MHSLFNIINKPLGWVLENISAVFGGNFAVAVFVFTLLINIILIPLSIKSQKSLVQQTRIKPKLDDLKKRYGDDRKRYSEEMQKLYQEEGVSLSGGGCLPMLLRLVLMLSIYYLIMSPITYLMDVDTSVIQAATKSLEATGVKILQGRSELQIIGAVLSGKIISPEILEASRNINFSFLGIDLTEIPEFSFNIFKDAQLIWIMPLMAFAAQLISGMVSTKMQKKVNPDAPSMTGMMLMMPVFSLFIGFTLPGGVTFYWACSSIISGVIQTIVQNLYGPHKMLSKERAKALIKQCDYEESQLKNIDIQ